MDVALSALGLDYGGVTMFLGIDPGRDKSGWALVDDEGNLCVSGIFRTEDAPCFFDALAQTSFPSLERFVLENALNEAPDLSLSELLMGDGTGKEFLLSLAQSASFGVKLVPERETTLSARMLYWRLHPPRGLWRLVSTKLRVPPRDIDDLAAWAIVLRYRETQSKK